MSNLVLLKGNDVFTNSLAIAEGTENKHRSVQRIIDKHLKNLEKFGRVRFEITPLETKGGIQDVKVYFLNEEQATFLITLFRNNDIVIDFKIKLVKEFYKMRKFILEKQSEAWIETRYQGKLTRKSETNMIKKLVEYAKEQGSQNADKLYMTYSKLANKTAGVKKRDEATITQLNNLSLIENIILHVIGEGIIADKHYKEIYQNCKKQLDAFKEGAYLEI